MASEIPFSYKVGATTYVLIRNRVGQIWNTSGTGAFTSYDNTYYSSYVVSAVEQGSSAYYTATMPSAIPAGVYNIVAKDQLGGSPAQTDPTVAVGDENWNGSAIMPLSDLATSGQVGGLGQTRLTRSHMVRNFPIYLKSATDHVTPLTSGSDISGQIARDGGGFGALQSGAFTEVGLGFYNLQALTSGDTNADTIKLLFTATGADPLPMSFITQPNASGL